MSGLEATLKTMSDAKRQLLEKRLRGKAIDTDHAPKVFQLVENPAAAFLPYPLRKFQQGVLYKGIKANDPAWFYLEAEKEGLDAMRFADAFRALVDFHPILKGKLKRNPQTAELYTDKSQQWNPVIHDLRGRSPAETENIQQLIREIFGNKKFDDDIEHALILDICILDNDRIRIHLGVDMLLLDLVSIEFLALQCRQLYEQRKSIAQIAPLSFRDYVLTENDFLAESFEAKKSRDYWQGKLESVHPLLTPADFSAAEKQLAPVNYGYSLMLLQKDLWKKLKQYASQRKLTGSMIVYAFFTLILSKATNREHFSLEMRLFRRFPFHSQVNDIMGQFSSGIVSSIDVIRDQPMEAYCRRVEDQTWRDLDHGYVDIVSEKYLDEAPGFTQPGIVFTSTISRYEEFVEEGAVPPMKWFGKTRTCVMQMPHQMLEMLIVENDGELECHWFYNNAYIQESSIRTMQSALNDLLMAAAQAPEVWLEKSVGSLVDCRCIHAEV